MRTSGSGWRARAWAKIDCSKCGAKAGEKCVKQPGLFVDCCKERLFARPILISKDEKRNWQERKPKPKKVVEVKKSKRCCQENHSHCHSYKCLCFCHGPQPLLHASQSVSRTRFAS